MDSIILLERIITVCPTYVNSKQVFTIYGAMYLEKVYLLLFTILGK